MKKLIVSAYFPDAACDLTGKAGEAIEVSLEDGSIRNAVLSFREFQKLLRFRHKQEEKGNGKPAP